MYTPLPRDFRTRLNAGGGAGRAPSRQDFEGRMRRRGADVLDASAAAAETPGPGLNPWFTQGADWYSRATSGAGQQGLDALSGNADAVQGLMNPYIQQVIGANNAEWDNINARGTQTLNSQATMAGAFGGTRQGVAEGVMRSNNARAQATQNAGLLSEGFGEAMGRARTLTGVGMQGAAMLPGFGMQARDVEMQTRPDLWRMAMLQGGMSGLPFNAGAQNEPSRGNRLLGALGGGIQGFMMGGPAGAAVGAIGGAMR